MLIVPLIILALMYFIMAISIVRNKIPVGRLLITTTAILLTGVFAVIPQTIMITWNVRYSYKVAQVLTVTLFHANCIFNPVIYYMANPRIAPQIKEQASVRTQSVKRTLSKTLSRTVSGFNLQTYAPVFAEDTDQRASSSK